MLTVLIVDDDANIRKLLDVTIKKAGFSVLTARDGNEAFVTALEHPPDVAVLDVMMPGLHGYELCKRFRANPSTAQMKIIFLTARSQPYDRQAGLDAGADLFLTKPVMPNELVEQIKALIAQPSAAPPETPPELKPQPEVAPPLPPPPPPSRPSGRMVACFSLVPQVGVTTLSVNLAIAFALARRETVPLVELHRAPAGLLKALGLGSRPLASPSEGYEGELRWQDLVPYLVDHPTGVRVLAVPSFLGRLPADWMSQAVALLRNRFPLAVADVTHQPDASIQSMLTLSDLVLLVVTPDVSTIRAALRAIEGLHALHLPDSNVLLVLNHVEAQAQVPVDKLQEGMKRKVFAVIPHSPNMSETLRAGRPLILAESTSPTAQAIGRLAMQIAKGLQLA